MNLIDFWPFGVATTKVFTNPVGGGVAVVQQTQPEATPNGQPGLTLLDLDANMTIMDRWHMTADPILGVLEQQDDFPNGNLYHYLQPAHWGSADMAVGDTIAEQMQLDPVTSIGIPDDARAWGWFTVTLVAVEDVTVPFGTFHNVARIDWTQSWDADPQGLTHTDNAGSFWFAQGIGVVQMAWSLPKGGAFAGQLAAMTINGIPTHLPGFKLQDGHQVWFDQGSAYVGPVIGLDREIIILTSNMIINAEIPNVFIHTGAGDDAIQTLAGANVIDGGSGSNFLVGGSGTDTFFVDDRGLSADVWSTIANFHAGDVATIWGVSPIGTTVSVHDGQGAAGYQGLTVSVTKFGSSTNLTIAGYSHADLGGRLIESFGRTADLPGLPGSDYLMLKAI